MRHTFFILTLGALLISSGLLAQTAPFSKGGATQQTPSKSEYFTWIDHTWEGSTEEQTLANLNFFKWLKDTYGMQLDIKVHMSLYPWDKGGKLLEIKK